MAGLKCDKEPYHCPVRAGIIARQTVPIHLHKSPDRSTFMKDSRIEPRHVDFDREPWTKTRKYTGRCSKKITTGYLRGRLRKSNGNCLHGLGGSRPVAATEG